MGGLASGEGPLQHFESPLLSLAPARVKLGWVEEVEEVEGAAAAARRS